MAEWKGMKQFFVCQWLPRIDHLINPTVRRKMLEGRDSIAEKVKLQEILVLLHPLSSFALTGLDKLTSFYCIQLGSKNQHKVLSVHKLQLSTLI